jgi:hypothetical protein
VKRQMESAAQIARAMKLENFSVPRKPKEEDLISTARSFVERMEPLKTEFSQHGLPPEKLKTSIQSLEESLLDRANGLSTRSGAIREFNKLLDEALNLVARFDAIINNTLTDDELVMAAWKVARQIDRLPQSAKAEVRGEPQPAADVPPSPPHTPPGGEAKLHDCGLESDYSLPVARSTMPPISATAPAMGGNGTLCFSSRVA